MSHQLKCLEGFVGIRQRIAGTGNAEHGHLRNVRGNGEHFFSCLLRRQPFTHNSRPRFIRAIVLAVAVVALNVAGWRHGHMHARIVVVRFFAVAGMVLHLLPYLRRQIALSRGRAATGLAACALRTTSRFVRSPERAGCITCNCATAFRVPSSIASPMVLECPDCGCCKDLLQLKRQSGSCR